MIVVTTDEATMNMMQLKYVPIFLAMGEKSRGDILAGHTSEGSHDNRRFAGTKLLSGGGGSRFGIYFIAGRSLDAFIHSPRLWQIPWNPFQNSPPPPPPSSCIWTAIRQKMKFELGMSGWVSFWEKCLELCCKYHPNIHSSARQGRRRSCRDGRLGIESDSTVLT